MRIFQDELAAVPEKRRPWRDWSEGLGKYRRPPAPSPDQLPYYNYQSANCSLPATFLCEAKVRCSNPGDQSLGLGTWFFTFRIFQMSGPQKQKMLLWLQTIMLRYDSGFKHILLGSIVNTLTKNTKIPAYFQIEVRLIAALDYGLQ